MSGIWDKLYQLYLLHCTALLRISFLLLFYWSILDACMADKSIESRFWIGKDFTTLIIKWAVHGQRFCQSPFNLGIQNPGFWGRVRVWGRLTQNIYFLHYFWKIMIAANENLIVNISDQYKIVIELPDIMWGRLKFPLFKYKQDWHALWPLVSAGVALASEKWNSTQCCT